MEKLKAKHDHKLTDILKVAIFALFLIMPGIMFLPSCMYYAVNKYATPPTSQVENTTEITLKQNVINGKPNNLNNIVLEEGELEGIVTNYLVVYQSSENGYFELTYSLNDMSLNTNDKLLIKFNAFEVDNGGTLLISESLGDFFYEEFQINNTPTDFSIITTNYETASTNAIYVSSDTILELHIKNLQIFNLTQMYGTGNEPTITQFNDTWTEEYYEYNVNYNKEIPNGTYTTYTDIPKELDLQWQSLWNKPILKWTNYTILKQGLDNFTYVFGITQTSYINNLIVYELIMVAIYIVIDIVLTLFKWLTHLVGEK